MFQRLVAATFQIAEAEARLVPTGCLPDGVQDADHLPVSRPCHVREDYRPGTVHVSVLYTGRADSGAHVPSTKIVAALQASESVGFTLSRSAVV